MNTTENTDTDAKKTFVVRVESVSEARARMREAAEAIDRGDDLGSRDRYGLSLPSDGRLNQVLSEKTIALLRTIARDEPASINETARMVDRDVHIVHDTLTDLEALGLIRFVEEGQAKRPVVWYGSLEIDIPIEGPDSATHTATS
ncbi:MAG: hypothetical protein IH933_14825 [Euryarchaeota archaeon]|nr:hypothetical protein [Euryarchaeota archaeon]